MPREQRPDHEPLIKVERELLDLRENLKRQNPNRRYNVNANLRTLEGFRIIHDRTEQRLREIRHRRKAEGIPALDEGLLHMLMSHFEISNAVHQEDKNGQPIVEDGFYVMRLVRVGCRIHMTHEEIAEEYGVSVITIGRQLDIMREEELIVNECKGYGKNKGESWYEFDGALGWRGDGVQRDAYVRHQPSMHTMTIISEEHVYALGQVVQNEQEN